MFTISSRAYGLRGKSLGFTVQSSGSRMTSWGFRAKRLGMRVTDLGFRVWGLGWWVHSMWLDFLFKSRKRQKWGSTLCRISVMEATKSKINALAPPCPPRASETCRTSGSSSSPARPRRSPRGELVCPSWFKVRVWGVEFRVEGWEFRV